ncbi:abortive infection protein [Calothrix sp. NIES-4071]|nr:abortive infection protein [Calothrix sp. NIES-4071]BAZ58931.1 abortive infection protein [Calothrix sp. NIES-4105]
MSQSYLEIAQQGKNSWWRHLLATLLILFFWLIIGTSVTSIAVVFFLVQRGLNLTDLSVEQVNAFLKSSSVESFITLNIPSIFFAIGIFLAVKLLHKRKFNSLISASGTINYQRILAGFGVWFLMLIVLLAVSLIFDAKSYEFTFNPLQWLPLLISALILTPIQTSSEELFFRGYLLQALSHITRNRLALIFVTSILFMLPHLFNPEMQRGAWMALFYFGFGALTALITLKDNRLELALGVHAANNLSFLFVTTKDSVLSVPAMWTAKDTGDPRVDVAVFLLQSAIFYYVFFGRRKKVSQAILDKTEKIKLG